MSRFGQRAYPWLLLILLLGFAALPALRVAVEEFSYDAALFHIYRAVIYSDAALDSWFPRWSNVFFNGAGSPSYSYYPSLVYFVIDLVARLGAAHTVAWRIWVVIALVGGGVGAFQLARSLFEDARIALVCGVVFGYSRYFVREFYERGAPQGFSIALVPWLFWLMLSYAQTRKRRHLAFGALTLAAIFWAHNVTGILLLPLIGLWSIWLGWRYGWAVFGRIIAMLALGISLVAFYLVPALLELSYVRVGADAGYFDWEWTQPALNPLGWRDIVGGWPIYDVALINQMGAGMLSYAELLLALAGCCALPFFWRVSRDASLRWPVAGAAVTLAAIIWLQTEWATPVWANMSTLDNFQFRWRLFSVSGILLVILTGAALKVRFQPALAFAIIGGTVALQLPSLYPELHHQYHAFSTHPDVAEAQQFILDTQHWELTSFGEFQPRWGRVEFSAADPPPLNLPVGAVASEVGGGSNWWRATITTPSAFEAVLPLHYFPGWAVRVDDQLRPIGPDSSHGLIQVTIPAGTHTLAATYVKTGTQRVSEAVSLLAVLVVVSLAAVGGGKSAELPTIVELPVRWGLVALLAAILLVKLLYIDPHTVLLRTRSTCGDVVAAQVQTQVQFGSDFWLCGYSLSSTSFEPGDSLELTLFWQAGSPEAGLSTFVTLFSDEPKLETAVRVAEASDGAPGGHAIQDWMAGRIYVGNYRLTIGEDFAALDERYQLEVGVWFPPTGDRLWPTIQQSAETINQSEYATILIRGLTMRR